MPNFLIDTETDSPDGANITANNDSSALAQTGGNPPFSRQRESSFSISKCNTPLRLLVLHNLGVAMTKKLESARIAEEINSIYENHASLEPARICLVLDPPLGEAYEFVVAILQKSTEQSYRKRISVEADYQLLWNPAEFSICGERIVRIKGSSPESVVSFGDVGHKSSLDEIEAIAIEACSVANERLKEFECFAFVVDSELSRLASILRKLRGVSAKVLSERPSWLK